MPIFSAYRTTLDGNLHPQTQRIVNFRAAFRMRIGGQRIPGITVALIVTESLCIALALLLATALRFRDLQALRQALSEPGTLSRFSIVLVVCILTLYYHDLYDLQLVSRRSVLFVRLLQSLGSACLILALFYFLAPDLSLGRGVAGMAAPIIITFVLAWRLVVDASAPIFRSSERILILGTSPAGMSLMQEVLARPELNIQVVGFLREPIRDLAEISVNPRPELDHLLANGRNGLGGHSGSDFDLFGASPRRTSVAVGSAVLDRVDPPKLTEEATDCLVSSPIIGYSRDVDRVALDQQVDRVVLSFSERRGTMPVPELLHLKFLGIKIEEVHSVYERITGRIPLDHLAPSWLILSEGFRKPRFLMATKRLLDIVVSGATLVLAAPIMLIVAFAIFVEGKAPVLFVQRRVGQHGSTFQILKFGSMRRDIPQSEQNWTADRDRRVTRVGRFIRKFRLDELPQLINVLRGEMSLVGPRPEQPAIVETLESEIPYYSQRHTSRPGITGWAQIKYGYGGTVEETRIKLEHDLFYIKHLSLALDLAIMFETGKVLLSGRGAK